MKGIKNQPSDALSRYTIAGNGCWIWNHVPTNSGYGAFCLDRIPRAAHRVVYELIKGPIPQGMQLDHLCRNRVCVNPDHLEPVTCRENLLRGSETHAARNAIKTHCKYGHPFSGANLGADRHGYKRCLTCHRELQKRWRAENPDRWKLIHGKSQLKRRAILSRLNESL